MLEYWPVGVLGQNFFFLDFRPSTLTGQHYDNEQGAFSDPTVVVVLWCQRTGTTKLNKKMKIPPLSEYWPIAVLAIT